MSLVLRNALIPSEDQQALRLRLVYFMRRLLFLPIFLALEGPLLAEINIRIDKYSRCFFSNGIPDHPVGKFPNKANPHAISAQNINLCVPINPQISKVITPISGTMGIAINGILYRPNTAGYWDPKSPRGHSPYGDKNWRLNIFATRGKLGLDNNNGHVGPSGLYHYHGIAKSLIDNSKSSLIGYAGDGFEIHYVGDKVSSGWSLKKGERAVGPSGFYDGTYNEDYEFIQSDEKLDQCNGAFLNSHYVYFITDEYPYIPRCLKGNVSDDFNKSRH